MCTHRHLYRHPPPPPSPLAPEHPPPPQPSKALPGHEEQEGSSSPTVPLGSCCPRSPAANAPGGSGTNPRTVGTLGRLWWEFPSFPQPVPSTPATRLWFFPSGGISWDTEFKKKKSNRPNGAAGDGAFRWQRTHPQGQGTGPLHPAGPKPAPSPLPH